jgi:hypothetical protein
MSNQWGSDSAWIQSDGCALIHLRPTDTVDLDITTLRNLKPGHSTISAYYFDYDTGEQSSTATYDALEDSVGEYSVYADSWSGGPEGNLNFNLQATDDYYLLKSGSNMYRNSLTGIKVTENGNNFSGHLTTQAIFNALTCCKAVDLITSNPTEARNDSKQGNAELVTYDSGFLKFDAGKNFGSVNAYMELRPSVSGSITYNFTPQSDDELTAKSYSKPSVAVQWPTLDMAKVKSSAISGLVGDRAQVGKAISVENVAGTCTVWTKQDTSGHLTVQEEKVGSTFTGETQEAGTTYSLVRFLEGVKVNNVALKTPCNLNNPGQRAPYYVIRQLVVADKMQLDWGGYKSNGLTYGKSQSHTVALIDKGFGLPATVKVRQKIGSGAVSAWKVTPVSNGHVVIKTTGKGNTKTEILVSDPSGSYTFAATAQLRPTVTSRMVWKSKTYVSGLWQGGVLRVYVSVSSWYKGKVSTLVMTSHGYDFLGYDHGQYSKVAWYKPINGSLVVDIPVSFHGMFIHNFAFVGSQNFTYTPGLGYSFD